jgi:hypothetical protein
VRRKPWTKSTPSGRSTASLVSFSLLSQHEVRTATCTAVQYSSWRAVLYCTALP